MRSLRARLLVGMIAGMAGLLVLFGAAVYTLVSRSLERAFHDALAVTARAVAGQVREERGVIALEDGDLAMPEFSRKAHPDYFEIWSADGKVLARSASLAAADLPLIRGAVDDPRFEALTLPNGLPGRAVGMEFVPRVEDEEEGDHEDGDNDHDKDKPGRTDRRAQPAAPRRVHLVVARESGELEARLRDLAWLILGGSALVIALSLGVAAGVVRRGLRPLNDLAADIAAIRTDRLQARVAPPGMPAEMVPVADRLNDLLARLQAAFERERCFASDVAHELRTPLAGMRATLEVVLARARNPGEYEQSLRDTLDIVRHMQAMVDNLLALARLEAGQVTLRPEAVGLAELLDTCWRPLAEAVRARGITYTTGVPADLACTADRASLSLVLANLLANAAEYANDGGRIEVAGGWAAGRVELAISNTGCRLSEEQASHVFERFWRGDSARTGTGVHCGLGLALVQRMVVALGGTVSAGVSDGVFTIRLVLPAG